MKIICEMILNNYFKLSGGYTALVGKFEPDLDELLTECKAYLYAGNNKICSINIIGEDKFTRVDEKIRQNRRAVRTSDDIYERLESINNEQKKLVFYKD